MPTIWFQAEAPRRSTRVYTGKLGEQLLTAKPKGRAVSTCILYYYEHFFLCGAYHSVSRSCVGGSPGSTGARRPRGQPKPADPHLTACKYKKRKHKTVDARAATRMK